MDLRVSIIRVLELDRMISYRLNFTSIKLDRKQEIYFLANNLVANKQSSVVASIFSEIDYSTHQSAS